MFSGNYPLFVWPLIQTNNEGDDVKGLAEVDWVAEKSVAWSSIGLDEFEFVESDLPGPHNMMEF